MPDEATTPGEPRPPEIDEASIADMDETRTVTYEHVRIQYAHPSRVRAAIAYQDKLYRELTAGRGAAPTNGGR